MGSTFRYAVHGLGIRIASGKSKYGSGHAPGGACPGQLGLTALLQVLVQRLTALISEDGVEAVVRPVSGCEPVSVRMSERLHQRVTTLVADLTILVTGAVV